MDPFLSLKVPNHADHNALDMEAVRFLHGDGLHRLIRGMQLNDPCFTLIGLNRRLAIEQCNDGLAVAGRILFLTTTTSPGRMPSSRMEVSLTRNANVSPRPNIVFGTSTKIGEEV